MFRWPDGAIIPTPFSNWGLDQPNNEGGLQHCMSLTVVPISGVQPGEWADRACDTESKPFICDPPATGGPSSPGCVEQVVFGRRRFLCANAATYSAAIGVCAADGGQLVRVRSAAENDAILQVAPTITSSTIWLGGTDQVEEGVWRWPDGGIFEVVP